MQFPCKIRQRIPRSKLISSTRTPRIHDRVAKIQLKSKRKCIRGEDAEALTRVCRPEDVHLDRLGSEHINAFGKIVSTSLPIDIPVEYLANEIKKPTSQCYGAFTLEDQLVGVIIGSVEEPCPPMPILAERKVISSAMFLIKVLAVDRNFRRLKIGRRLMNRVIEDVKTLNENRRFQQTVEAIYLQVMCENLPAISLYESLGFEIISLIPGYYSTVPKRDAFIMVKII